jgi:Protein of unknown function (DUF3095)
MSKKSFFTNENFYQNIVPFSDFSQVLDDSYYIDAPENWRILLTDIKGSTQAIQEGRYQQVNMIGAASITCVLNALGSYAIPFVFGGDGATLLIPPEAQQTICNQLKGLQLLAQDHFGIDLRVGLVPLHILRAKNLNLKVAKYELSPGNCLAQFRGGALSAAEDMIKKNDPEATIITPQDREKSPNLNGLSCRLNPLKSQRGEILSLLCKPRKSSQAEKTLQMILGELKSILGNDFHSASPVSPDRLSWKYIPRSFKDEVSISQKNGETYLSALVKVFFRTLIANISIKKNIKMGGFVPEKYKRELAINSDFKKFDEMLRMVIDCTPSQAEAIEQLLQSQFNQKNIFFGIHKSSDALMTCMVFSASQNQHIHFIDGSDGGYALAAVSMKKQIKLAH